MERNSRGIVEPAYLASIDRVARDRIVVWKWAGCDQFLLLYLTALAVPLSLIPSTGIPDVSWGSNSGPKACTASTLPTEPSLQPPLPWFDRQKDKWILQMTTRLFALKYACLGVRSRAKKPEFFLLCFLQHFSELLDEFSQNVLGQLLNDPFLSEKSVSMEVEPSPTSPAPLIQAEHSYSLSEEPRAQSPFTHVTTSDGFNDGKNRAGQNTGGLKRFDSSWLRKQVWALLLSASTLATHPLPGAKDVVKAKRHSICSSLC